jgi:hypothetical protein
MSRAPFRKMVFAGAIACALLTAPITRAAGVDPSTATPVQREQAQQRFNRGRELFVRKQYAQALREFEGSHEIVASPNARLFVARCHRELGQLVAAYVELGRVAAEAHEFEHEDPRYAKTAESANTERDEIAPKLGFVLVTVEHATDATTLSVGGDEIKRAGWGEPAPVLPGTTEIVVQTPGHAPVKATLSLAAAERKPVTLDAALGELPPPVVAAPAPPPAADVDEEDAASRRRLRTFAIVAGGVGAAGLVTFAVAGSLSNGAYSDLQKQCHGPCPSSQSSLVSKGKTEQTIANVGLIVGAVGAVAGVTLFVVSLPKSHAAAAPKDSAIVVGPTWIGMRGAF